MTNISPFQGIALIDRNCTPEVIWYFPVEDLPEDVGERFNTLFKTREKWSLAEISPYVRYIFYIIFISVTSPPPYPPHKIYNIPLYQIYNLPLYQLYNLPIYKLYYPPYIRYIISPYIYSL